MSVHHRVQDILIGVIFGIILGAIVNLWSSVFDHLFLENISKDILSGIFIIFSIGIVGIGFVLWQYIKKLGKNE